MVRPKPDWPDRRLRHWTTEVGKLKAEVASLRRQLSILKATRRCKGNNRSIMRTQSRSPSLNTSMQQAGKRLSQQLGATNIAGPTQSCLFYVTDRTSGLKFLIDTGAEVSVVSRLHTHKKTEKGPSSQAINNTSIPKYGTCSLTLNLGLCRAFKWVFIIADVSRVILGADFLSIMFFQWI